MNIVVDTIGALLIATLLQVWFYGVASYQYACYFYSGLEDKDPLWIRGAVLMFWSLNTIHVATTISLVWNYCIASFGHIEVFLADKIPVTILISYMSLVLSVFVAQLFLLYRAYRLLALSTWRYYAVPLGLLLAVAECACGTLCATKLYLLPSMQHLGALRPWVISWLVVELVADFVIAGILAWALKLFTTSFRVSQKVVRRLLSASIHTGAIVALFATTAFIIYMLRPNTYLSAIPSFPIGCLYCTCVMATLVSRQGLRDMFQGAELQTFKTCQRMWNSNTRGTEVSGVNISVEIESRDSDKGKAREWLTSV